ncbi:MAG TPA: DUF6493 family protein [Thermoanaerobaculia bacterium]
MPDFSVLAPAEFMAWVNRAGRQELIEALCSLGEKDRKRFAKEAAAAHQEVRKAEGAMWRYDLALAATAGWTEVRKIGRGLARWSNLRDGTHEDLVTIIAARKPDWAGKYVERELEVESTQWPAVRRLIREGACPRPASDEYIRKMISTHAAGWTRDDRELTLLERLRADPGLFEYEIWRIFEIDPAEGTLFPSDEASWNGKNSWGGTLIELAAEGAIDRTRLLQATHETLRRGIQAKDTAFHLRLIERLAPTSDERAALGDVYLDLLGHRADPVVRFALASCETLVKERTLAPRTVLERIAPALQREKKGPVEAALKLIRRIVKNDRSLAQEAARVAAEALRHPDSGIHEKALDLLEALGAPEVAGEYAEHIAPSQRARVATPAAASDGIDVDGVIARARALDPEHRSRFGIEPLLAALESGEDLPRHVPSEHVPRLGREEEVRPIADFTELVETLLFVIEGRPEALDIERALDGFSRLGANRPADHRDRTAALLKSVQTPPTGFSDWSMAAEVVKTMVVAWGGKVSQPRTHGTPEAFLALRAQEIVRRVAGGRSAPTLALPTHGPWIDPRRLVERLQEYARTGTRAGKLDLVQALLRLAPEHREEALRAAEGLPGEEGMAVRYALGGGLPVMPGVAGFTAFLAHSVKSFFSRSEIGPPGADGPVWRAAAHAYSPFADDVRYQWSVRTHKQAWTKTVDYFIEIQMPPARDVDPEWPLSLFPCKGQRWITGSAVDAQHRATIHPIDPTPTLIAGIHAFVDRMFRPASAMTATAAYLRWLLDPHAPVGELAELAVALALVTQDADARTMAVDVAIALIGDGRLRGDELGRVYARLWAMEGFLKLGRVAAVVEPIARESRVHQVACARLLEELLAAMQPPAPKDVHHLLGAYRELLAGVNRGCDPRLTALLTSIGGSGKTPKLAREILAMDGSRTADAAVTAQILETRLNLAG